MRLPIELFHPHELEFFTYGDQQAGPHLFITAGIHGGEATGIWVARQICSWLGGQSLSGFVTVLPVANPAAYRRSSRYSPYDELDMNRIFPGKEGGTPTLAAARLIWELAVKADYLLDLHCCGIYGSDYTLALWNEFPEARAMAEKIDIPVIVQSGGIRQQLFVEACHAGIPAVVIEFAGGQTGLQSGGVLNRASGERGVTAVQNLVRRLGIAPGPAPAINPTLYGKLQEVQTGLAGLWEPMVQSGEAVEEGALLGRFESQEVYAPARGIAISVQPDRYLFPGQAVASVAPRA